MICDVEQPVSGIVFQGQGECLLTSLLFCRGWSVAAKRLSCMREGVANLCLCCACRWRSASCLVCYELPHPILWFFYLLVWLVLLWWGFFGYFVCLFCFLTAYDGCYQADLGMCLFSRYIPLEEACLGNTGVLLSVASGMALCPSVVTHMHSSYHSCSLRYLQPLCGPLQLCMYLPPGYI